MSQGSGRQLRLDVRRTSLQSEFFRRFGGDPERVLARIAGMEADVDSLVGAVGRSGYHYNGWLYWFLYVKGYVQFLEGGGVGERNSYFDYVLRYSLPYGRDPALMRQLADPQAVRERILRRFEDLDCLRRAPDSCEEIDPVTAFVSRPPPKKHLLLYLLESARPVKARRLDGHHRIFAAKLWRASCLRLQLVEERRRRRRIMGAIERFSLDDDGLTVTGWLLDPEVKLNVVEVRQQNEMLQVVAGIQRPDVEAALPEPLRGKCLGFRVSGLPAPTDGATASFDILGLSRWNPRGGLTVYWPPDCGEATISTPSGPLNSIFHVPDEIDLAFRSYKCLTELVLPLSRHRAPESFQSVLDWGAGCGLLQVHLRRFLPKAQITAADFHLGAVKWLHKRSGLPGEFVAIPRLPPTEFQDNRFDLVIGSLLTVLPASAHLPWIRELDRLLKPGGFLALIVNGEFLRPFLAYEGASNAISASGASTGASSRTFPGVRTAGPKAARLTCQTQRHAMETCSACFEVLDYLPGAFNCLQDLILCRSRKEKHF